MKVRTTGKLTALVLVAIGVLILMVLPLVAVEAAYPVERVRQTFMRKAWTRVHGLFKGAEAAAENTRLRREVAALAMLKDDVERLESENARLRRALNYVAKDSGSWVAAGVLSRGGGAAGVARTIRVDKGSLAGIREGAVVAVPEGLVGKVTMVTLHTSEVTLITDRSLKVSCEVEYDGAARIRGILVGDSDDFCLLRHLTDVAEVPPRSRVFTSGHGGIFPRGITVGTLLGIRKDADGLASEGEVLPAVEYSTLEDVFIRREK